MPESPGNAEPIRAFRMPDWLYRAAQARAEAESVTLSAAVRRLLEAWLGTEGDSTMSDSGQLALVGTAPRAGRGYWEKLAGRRIRELTKAGYFTPATAGYADALRMAGRNLDHAEAVGSTRDRIAAANAWHDTIARIVPQPSESATASADSSDPWAELGNALRSAALGD